MSLNSNPKKFQKLDELWNLMLESEKDILIVEVKLDE